MWSVHRGDQLTACHGRLEHHSLRSNSIVVPFYFPDNILQTLRKVLVKLWQKHNNTWMRCRKETSTNKSSCYKDILIKSYLRPRITNRGFRREKKDFPVVDKRDFRLTLWYSKVSPPFFCNSTMKREGATSNTCNPEDQNQWSYTQNKRSCRLHSSVAWVSFRIHHCYRNKVAVSTI